MSLSKKKNILSKDAPHAHPPTHRPSPPSSFPSSSSSHSARASSSSGSSNLGDNRPPSPQCLKCGTLIPNHASTTNDSGKQVATPRYANRKAKQLARPSSAPGQPHPCPTAAPQSFTTCHLAPNLSGLHRRTQQRPLSLSPASSSTTQVSKMPECPADVSPLVSSFAFARSLARSPFFPQSLYFLLHDFHSLHPHRSYSPIHSHHLLAT